MNADTAPDISPFIMAYRLTAISAIRKAASKCPYCDYGQISQNVRRLPGFYEHQHSECVECDGWGFGDRSDWRNITSICLGREARFGDLYVYRTFLEDAQIAVEAAARDYADDGLERVSGEVGA